jgi:uncharacterized protein YaaN involved in tellurite resistance
MIQLTLTAPDAVTAVPADQATGLVPVDGAARSRVQAKVDAFVADLLSLDVQSPDFSIRVGQISSIGQKEINALTGQSSRFLDRSNVSLGGSVGEALAALRKLVEDLDPGRKGDLLKPRKFLGLIPLGDRLKAYFDSYASAQAHIQAILASLSRGRDELLQDNIAIDTERARMWEQMGRLEEMILTARMLDMHLEERASGFPPGRANAWRENAVFNARQRHTDLLTHMAVTVQAYLALDLIKKNNAELIKGIDRASTTTIAALRTAVIVAQALSSQKLVLAQITALNTAASNSIDASGQMLRENADTNASPTAQVEVLQRAFANITATMDAVDAFKAKALGNMKRTIDALSLETEKAQGYIARSGAGGEPARLGPA